MNSNGESGNSPYASGSSPIEKLPPEIVERIHTNIEQPTDQLNFNLTSRTLYHHTDSRSAQYLHSLQSLHHVGIEPNGGRNSTLPDGVSDEGETFSSRKGLIKFLKMINAIDLLGSASEAEIPFKERGYCFDTIVRFIAKATGTEQYARSKFIQAMCETYTKLPREHQTPTRFHDIRACIHGGTLSTGETTEGLHVNEDGKMLVPDTMRAEGIACASIDDKNARRTGYQDIVARIHGALLRK